MGDGIGGTEQKIGKFANKEVCYQKCMNRRYRGKLPNGVTVDSKTQKQCYCEYGMRKRNRNAAWINTFIKRSESFFQILISSSISSCSSPCSSPSISYSFTSSLFLLLSSFSSNSTSSSPFNLPSTLPLSSLSFSSSFALFPALPFSSISSPFYPYSLRYFSLSPLLLFFFVTVLSFAFSSSYNPFCIFCFLFS